MVIVIPFAVSTTTIKKAEYNKQYVVYVQSGDYKIHCKISITSPACYISRHL